jgi:hypothetical protein
VTVGHRSGEPPAGFFGRAHVSSAFTAINDTTDTIETSHTAPGTLPMPLPTTARHPPQGNHHPPERLTSYWLALDHQALSASLSNKSTVRKAGRLLPTHAHLAFRHGLSEATRLTRSIGGFFSASPPV